MGVSIVSMAEILDFTDQPEESLEKFSSSSGVVGGSSHLVSG